MDDSSDVPDPTDWNNTPVPALSSLESALHCQICKDFFQTPMITTCSHTFCSLCIRRCLTDDGVCPACRSQDQMMKLRQNWAVQELVEAFQQARPTMLKLAKSANSNESLSSGPSRKRKVEDTDQEDEDFSNEPAPRRRMTRSRQTDRTDSQSRQRHRSIRHDQDYQPDDGLIACPICGERMKEAQVFPHLDVHNDDGSGKSRKLENPSRASPYFGQNPDSRPVRPMERLPQINYSLLKDNALRKKLGDLGIPSSGPRELLIRRHTEWVNLVNANCDSKHQRTKRDLLRDLDTWDRTQGRHVGNGASSSTSVMHKDFDGAAWSTSHANDYKELIANARKKAEVQRKKTKEVDETKIPKTDSNWEDAITLSDDETFEKNGMSASPARGAPLPARAGTFSLGSPTSADDRG